MYTFLVLGLIPGTNIQIGFWSWIIIVAALAVAFKLSNKYIIKHVGAWWHQFDEDLEDLPREPLHASRLHLRGL